MIWFVIASVSSILGGIGFAWANNRMQTVLITIALVLIGVAGLGYGAWPFTVAAWLLALMGLAILTLATLRARARRKADRD